jgi:erythromycin esterase
LPALTPDQELVKIMEEQAKPLNSVEPQASLNDLQPLKTMIKDASIVGLGEATHGTSEIYKTKHRLVKFLVTEMEYTNIVLEVEWGVGTKLNHYIQSGKGDPKQLFSPLFRSKEMLQMIEWMRDYNANPKKKKKIQLFGMDITSADQEVYGSIKQYVKKYQPDLLPVVEKNYRVLEKNTDDLMKYVQLPVEQRKQFIKQAQAVVQLLDQNHKQLEQKSTSLAFMQAKQNATIITQITEMLSSNDLKDSFNPHDKFMADNVKWVKQNIGGKTIVWAHNAHVSKGLINPEYYGKMTGQYLSEQFGREYVVIGTSVSKGKYAVVDQNQQIVSQPIKSNEKSLNHILEKVFYHQFFLDLRQANQPLWKQWLKKKNPFLDGAAGNDPSLNQYANLSLSDHFDVLVHIQKSNPTQYP